MFVCCGVFFLFGVGGFLCVFFVLFLFVFETAKLVELSGYKDLFLKLHLVHWALYSYYSYYKARKLGRAI